MKSWIFSPDSPLSCFSFLLPLSILHHHVNSNVPSLSTVLSPVSSILYVFRYAACSPGGTRCSSEKSSDPRSAPALSGQLLFIQPETQTGSATAPGCTLH